MSIPKFAPGVTPMVYRVGSQWAAQGWHQMSSYHCAFCNCELFPDEHGVIMHKDIDHLAILDVNERVN